MTMVDLQIRQNRVGPIKGRHPWVFSGAFISIPEKMESGTPVRLVDEDNNFLAQGYFNSYSQIAVRVWSWNESEEVNEEFFEKRIKNACEIRKNYIENKGTDSYRLVNSENDLLPGLVVDKYADYLCVQFHTRGMEVWKQKIIDALEKVIKPKGIFERSDVGNRAKEQSSVSANAVIPTKAEIQESKTPDSRFHGNDKEKDRVGLLYGKVPEKIKIEENGLKFLVDVAGGQKTGFFLDQRDKRNALKKYVKGKNVLNCFSYTGGFSVYALEGGAKKVISVDVSESALKIAEENVLLNKFAPCRADFLQADVKVYLTDLVNLHMTSPVIPPSSVILSETKDLLLISADSSVVTLPLNDNKEGNGNMNFDVIILDPPAFIKDRHKIKEGIQGYRKINEMAMRLLPPGGILVSASCSAHLSLPDFRYMLSEAAGRAGRTLQILETFTHSIDHPELVAFTEGEYLKCVFAKVS